MTKNRLKIENVLEDLAVLSLDLNDNVDWATIGGTGVFLHLIDRYGYEEAVRRFRDKRRDSDDMDIILRYPVFFAFEDMYGTLPERSLSIEGKYVFKDKRDDERKVHADIYVPTIKSGYTEVMGTKLRGDIFEKSGNVYIDGGEIKVASIADLLALKYHAIKNVEKNRGRPREKDLIDVYLLMDIANDYGVDVLKEFYNPKTRKEIKEIYDGFKH